MAVIQARDVKERAEAMLLEPLTQSELREVCQMIVFANKILKENKL